MDIEPNNETRSSVQESITSQNFVTKHATNFAKNLNLDVVLGTGWGADLLAESKQFWSENRVLISWHFLKPRKSTF